ncbi:MAG TPA: FAD-binding oxidoreductase [Vicinamibacteria bacterium]|nr:FAD-binding oxidoreductase [Vicinamibacteria bacterium]
MRDDVPMLSGWGRLPRPGREVMSEDLRALTEDAVLSRGLGRSYGDSSLPPPGHLDVATTVLADRILSFDETTGVIRAEAGLGLHEINRLFLGRRWFTPVTPGTQYVTLGGMVAADVHGKNHHVEGTFGGHVNSLLLRVADGRLVECGPETEADLFWATVGGMGLTGHILEVSFRMRRIPSPWILEERHRFPNLETLMEGLESSAKDWPFTVGWLDSLSTGSGLGRGIVNRGRWAEPHEAPKTPPPSLRRITVPFELPNWVLNAWSIRAFNAAIYYRHARPRRGVVHPETFFYPLDKILEWNRIYGRRGFTQYQCVLPDSAGRGAVRRFLETVARAGGAGSFLSVIKDCAAEGLGLLSFPCPGTSIALDLAVGPRTQVLVDELNEVVIAEGGRIYLAKDAFTRPEHFRRMEPRLGRFLEVRRRWDPHVRIRSAQSVRVLGDPT